MASGRQGPRHKVAGAPQQPAWVRTERVHSDHPTRAKRLQLRSVLGANRRQGLRVRHNPPGNPALGSQAAGARAAAAARRCTRAHRALQFGGRASDREKTGSRSWAGVATPDGRSVTFVLKMDYGEDCPPTWARWGCVSRWFQTEFSAFGLGKRTKLPCAPHRDPDPQMTISQRWAGLASLRQRREWRSWTQSWLPWRLLARPRPKQRLRRPPRRLLDTLPRQSSTMAILQTLTTRGSTGTRTWRTRSLGPASRM